jgi:4-alpha-glucanotransferase
MHRYQFLLHSLTADKWRQIGINRRAGVVVPLFSIYSRNSIGIGEIPDLKKIVDWCRKCGMSLLQLLPLNDFGNYPAPYNAISTFAIEPAYLSLKNLTGTTVTEFKDELILLRKKYPKRNLKVNYEIKSAKIELLKKIFLKSSMKNEKFQKFIFENEHWLKYYVLFKIIYEAQSGIDWEKWDFKFKYFSSAVIKKILDENEEEKLFHYWIQWQLYEQLREVKSYANENGVFLMGDLPFLVSRNSADVWAYKNYFKLDVASGAPPDMFFSNGQKWGMPPYDWFNIAADNFNYIKQRLQYAENFYDMFRIDHFIGLFRLWTIDLKLPEEFGGLYGRFDPEDDRIWETHGRSILKVMNDSTAMLPCAEDLGTVPDCSYNVLNEFGIPGIDVQRWKKEWRKGSFEFIPSENYRLNSSAAISTHDSSFLPQWWKSEAGTVDEQSFNLLCEKLKLDYSWLRENLFQNENIPPGKLLWKDEIDSPEKLLKIIDKKYSEAHELVHMYLISFNEKEKFLKYIGYEKYLKLSTKFIRSSLEKISSSSSIFSIQTIMDWLYLDKNFLKDHSDVNYRINSPGIVSDMNWSIRIPYSTSELLNLDINDTIKKINLKHDRS